MFTTRLDTAWWMCEEKTITRARISAISLAEMEVKWGVGTLIEDALTNVLEERHGIRILFVQTTATGCQLMIEREV